MKKLALVLLCSISFVSFGQGKDAKLIGKWELFEIIDNVTGLTIPITHKTDKDFSYYVEFIDSLMKYNLEINKCENEYSVNKKREIEFKYFSTCSEFCCDDEFSTYLNYEDVTKYYIKTGKIGRAHV